MGECECHGWTATHDHMPPNPAVLRVQGECIVDQLGTTVELVRRVPQGINPKDLLMDLVVIPPEVGAPARLPIEVRYEEETEFEYDTVTILGYEAGIKVLDVT